MIGFMRDTRVAVFNARKVREVHSKIALHSSLDCKQHEGYASMTYRQERHGEIQTSDDCELLHTLVLVGTFQHISLILPN